MFSTNRYQMYFVLRFSVSSRGETVKTGVAGGPDTRRGRLRCLLVSGEQSRPGTLELTLPRRAVRNARLAAELTRTSCVTGVQRRPTAPSHRPLGLLDEHILPRHKPDLSTVCSLLCTSISNNLLARRASR